MTSTVPVLCPEVCRSPISSDKAPLEGLLSHSSYTMEGSLPPRTTLGSLLTGLSHSAHVGGLSSGWPEPPRLSALLWMSPPQACLHCRGHEQGSYQSTGLGGAGVQQEGFGSLLLFWACFVLLHVLLTDVSKEPRQGTHLCLQLQHMALSTGVDTGLKAGGRATSQEGSPRSPRWLVTTVDQACAS